MRSNWAGETGAVAIYRGCHHALEHVAIYGGRAQLQKFVEEHVASEEAHLKAMESVWDSEGDSEGEPKAVLRQG